MAIPGFVGGVLFTTLHRLTARRRRFDEVSAAPLIAVTTALGAGVAIGSTTCFRLIARRVFRT